MLERLKTGLRHAFAVEPPGHEFTEEDTRIVDKVAEFIVKRRMTAPAVVFIKSSAPLNMIGSQFLVFLKPFATVIFKQDEYTKFARILEHRNSIDFVVERIEEAQRKLHLKQAETGGKRVEKEVGQGT